MSTNPLLAQFASQPALVEPSMSGLFQSCLESVVAHSRFNEAMAISGADDFWDEEASWLRPYEVSNGILQIPVRGVLMNDFPYQFMGYATGYEYIQKALERGMSDPNVKGIAFIINSPGGIVTSGMAIYDTMQFIKPDVSTICVGQAASMGSFLLAAGAPVADVVLLP